MQARLEAFGRLKFECDALKKQVQTLEHKLADSNRSEASKMARLQTAHAELERLRQTVAAHDGEVAQLHEAVAAADAAKAAACRTAQDCEERLAGMTTQLQPVASTVELNLLVQHENGVLRAKVDELLRAETRMQQAAGAAEHARTQNDEALHLLQVLCVVIYVDASRFTNRMKPACLYRRSWQQHSGSMRSNSCSKQGQGEINIVSTLAHVQYFLALLLVQGAF